MKNLEYDLPHRQGQSYLYRGEEVSSAEIVSRMLARMERDLAHWKNFRCCPKRQRTEPTGSRQQDDQLHQNGIADLRK